MAQLGVAPSQNRSFQAFQVVFLIVGLIVAPATLTLRTVRDPGVLQFSTDNPSPYGYTWSLLLFLIPLTALGCWFVRRPDAVLARKAFLRTIAILAPLGCILDLLFGNRFFIFLNEHATLGLGVPAVGGPIPFEEFAFYLSGFMLVLLSYIWADEYWMKAYNVPDYGEEARDLDRIAHFHLPSVILGFALISAAAAYKKLLSDSPDGFPWYFTYLTAVSIIPSAGFFRTALPFINWRAFSFTFFVILLISLLWEVTLAMPLRWWGYRPEAMMGVTIDAWYGLPFEAVAVWLAVSYTTIITYEVIKIWQALNTGALKAFFGVRQRPADYPPRP